MKQLKFDCLDDCIQVYGRENLIAIDNVKQIIQYVRHGCQPKFVYENENKPGRITCWFLKNETAYVYKLWLDSNPRKNDTNGA